MRGPEDLIRIKVMMEAIVDLDRERIVEDPAWAAIADNIDLNDPEQREQALFVYLGLYIRREQKKLFDSVFMPSTNGPADMTIKDMEDVTNGNGNHSRNLEVGGNS